MYDKQMKRNRYSLLRSELRELLRGRRTFRLITLVAGKFIHEAWVPAGSKVFIIFEENLISLRRGCVVISCVQGFSK
jgi:hypothetical protein